ncbi:MAG: hypothetical protein KAJ20_00370 [Candidatus Aenigmarchaeota archaeon]|nr:hypothetical protein [Candidatus Aenigmarchaeota archaeon]MCK5063059.1 hypothetical protein [Candidatus Aenigmarchaeota archaeon]MCK5234448.1 hypothetical protein [Candidatus Aenigmarchaeota archaeon]MCK5289326.1 hypothetical protein [Candidatus Aenigmarchaeota archaeon]MCK5372773.1 hypothetical protein [Candidatus Aenigmarchaeota archaeon]
MADSISTMKQDMRHNVHINCSECGNKNIIPISKFYDAFDGVFICEECGSSLDNANDALDE